MPWARHRAAINLLLASAVILTGCTKATGLLRSTNSLSTASTTPVSLDALAELGQKWDADPMNVNKGLAYADGLESVGQKDQALDVYQKLADTNLANGKLAGVYGRKLVAAGKAGQAIPVLESAEQKGDTDWRVMSALGTAYDQRGLYPEAREQYSRALRADPQNLTVMNNLAMSYALEGNLKKAETELRAADALPNSRNEPRIRQNLALVVGLQGRFDEATKLAQEDLPPAQVQANMVYLNKMLSQPNTWQQVSNNGTKG